MLMMTEQRQQMDTAIGINNPRISVVIPARNEACNLPSVLPRIPPFVSEVILVDGHSQDETIAVAQQLLPTIHIIRQIGEGKGNALQLGFAACSGDIIVTLDADGSADPGEIPKFVAALLDGNDFAKGSRFMPDAGSHDFTWLRYLGNFGLKTLVNLLFGTKFSDLCYGYNAFWRHCLDIVQIDGDGFEIETLMSIRAFKEKLQIIEIPSLEHARLSGKSHLNPLSDGWRILQAILQERKNNGHNLTTRSTMSDASDLSSCRDPIHRVRGSLPRMFHSPRTVAIHPEHSHDA